MTTPAVVAIGLVVMIAALVGAFIAIVAQGSDATAIGAAAAAGGAFLGGILVSDWVQRRKGGDG